MQSGEIFLILLSLPRKAVLVRNTPSHPNVEEFRSDDIKIVFIPPNVILLCQPNGVTEAKILLQLSSKVM